VVLIQVASSASEIPELEAQVAKIAMRINSAFSTLTHQPLVFLRQDISYSQFLALLSVAEIFMATNLREGLNLTSHDFIHCQDGELSSQKHGSLILSEFTGSASVFQGHELLVNPWDYKQCADAINKALELSPEQKKRNWQYLLDRKSPYTALAWFSNLQTALTESHNSQRPTHSVSPLQVNPFLTSYHAAQSRLLFLEEGSLFSAEALDILRALALDPKNTVYLTSNRSSDQLDLTTKSLPIQVGLIAECGCLVKTANENEWKDQFDTDRARNCRAGVRKVIEYFAERTEGSTIEERRCSVTFHYEHAVDQELAAHQASELADQINGSRGREAIRVVREAGSVTVEPLHASKAATASMILGQGGSTPASDFVLVAGGARGDEALFRWANGLTLPVAVTTLATGASATEAKTGLPAGSSLLDVLRALLIPDQSAGSEDKGSHVTIDE
jgi:trehalose-phosphatase